MQQVSDKETGELLKLLEEALAAPGDVVEFGCYRGETSVLFQKLLAERAPEKKLWLYDSFAGLPAKTAEDNSAAGDQFQQGELFVTKREVVNRFKKANLPLPIIKKRFFEELDAVRDLPGEIAFAFLDGDLYRSVKVSLELVAPKVSRGGIIVVHDYNNPELPGAAKAVDEFMDRAGKGGTSVARAGALPGGLTGSLSAPQKFSQRETLAILRIL